MKLKQNSPGHLVVLGLVVAGVLLGCAQSVTAQWSPIANPTPSPGTNIYYNSGNVGIGTSAPSAPLHVKGTLAAPATSGSAQNGFSRLSDPSTSGAALDMGVLSSPWYAWIQSRDTTDYSANGPLALNPNGGKVGIGTSVPSAPLHVRGTLAAPATSGSAQNGFFRLSDPSTSPVGLDVGVLSSPWYAWIQFRDVNDYSANGPLALNPNGGNVGIGTTSPGYKLHVNGTINSNSTITANNIVAKYQDVAEWVESSEQLAAGTVVVLDSTKSNQVISSSVSYDTRVAGVISAQPGIALGEKSDNKVLVATTGRVKVKVDASRGPIHIGDLLVTSNIPGVAMKSEAVNLGGVQIHRPGTLIGKALEPLEKGKGEILVLLSLQ
jgi:hypothetical protein